MSISVDEFANAIIEEYKKFTDDVKEGLEKEIFELADDGRNMLKNYKQPPTTTLGTAHERERRVWKNYCKSWSVRKEQKFNYSKARIHNAKYYRLTHLLEFGHATKNGKRTRAFAHIEPVENVLVDKLSKHAEAIIENGGKK